MKRASASAPSGPAASAPGESSIGNLPSRARVAAPLLDSLIAPSAIDGRHFAHTTPPRDTTKYTVDAAPLSPLRVAQMRQRVNSSPKPAHPSSRSSKACRSAASAKRVLSAPSASASTRYASAASLLRWSARRRVRACSCPAQSSPRSSSSAMRVRSPASARVINTNCPCGRRRKYSIDVRKWFELALEATPRRLGALGDSAELAGVARQQRDDSIGFGIVARAQHDRRRWILRAACSNRRRFCGKRLC